MAILNFITTPADLQPGDRVHRDSTVVGNLLAVRSFFEGRLTVNGNCYLFHTNCERAVKVLGDFEGERCHLWEDVEAEGSVTMRDGEMHSLTVTSKKVTLLGRSKIEKVTFVTSGHVALGPGASVGEVINGTAERQGQT